MLSQITKRLRASDPAACAELFDRVHEPLVRYAARMSGDADVAYDIVQDAFIKLWERRRLLDPTRSTRALLYRMVRNMTVDEIRTHERRLAASIGVDPPAPTPSAHDEVLALELGQRMTGWIAELPARRREAFELSRFEGLTHQEVADVMGLDARTATNHIMLALQTLRDRLADFRNDAVPLRRASENAGRGS